MGNDLIEIGVKFIDVSDGMKKAVSTAERLESRMVKLAKAAIDGTKTQNRLAQSLIISGRELKKNSDLTANQAYGAVVKYYNAQKKSILVENQAIAATKAASLATQQKVAADKQAAAAAKQQATEEERLKNKFVAGYTTMNIYTKELNDLAVARSKDIISIEGQKAAVTKLNAQMAAGSGAFAKVGGHMQQTARKTNQLGVMMQQTGYQVGDFAVQVGSGQSVMVAFGQQATQLVGTMAMFAKTTKFIALFSGLGIAIPIITGIAGAFMRTKNAAKDAGDSIKTLKDKMKSANDATTGFADEIERLNLGLKDANEQALFRGVELAAKKLLDAQNALIVAEGQRGQGSRATVLSKEVEVAAAKELLALAKEELDFHIEQRDIRDAILASQAETLRLEKEEVEAAERLKESQLSAHKSAVDSLNVATNLAALQLNYTDQLYIQNAMDRAAVILQMQRNEITSDQAQTQLEMIDALYKQNVLLADAATEARELESAIKAAADAMASLSGFSDGLDIKIAQESAKLVAMTEGANVANAGFIAGERAKAGALRDSALALANNHTAILEVNRVYDETISKVDELENVKGAVAALAKANRDVARSGSAAADSMEDLVKEALKLNEDNDPLLKFNNGVADLNELMATGKLTQRAYNIEIGKLQDGLIDSIPLVAELSSAFTDFVGRGFKDFKGFVRDVLQSFKNMLLNMMEMAAKNRIMVSLGHGGMPIPKDGGTMSSMLGTMGTGASMAAGSGVTGFMGTLAGGTGAMGAVGNFAAGGYSALTGTTLATAASGTAAAAIGAIAAPLLAIAAVFSFFKKKVKVLDTGLKIMVDGFTVAAESFEKIRTTRFFGLSNKDTTTTKALSDEETSPLQDAVNDIQNAVVDAANALDLGSAAWDSFSYEFKLSLKGLDDAAKDAAIVAELTKMGDAFASLTGHFETMEELLATAAQRQVLNIRLLELQGNTEKVLTLNREAELNATHDLNKPMLLHIHALQDQATAYANLSNAMTNLGSAMAYALSEAKSGLDTATANLSNAIASEVKGINSSFDSILDNLNEGLSAAVSKAEASQAIFDLLKTSLSDRTSVAQGSYGASRTSALSYVSSGGTDIDKLSSALGVLNAPSEQLFGTFEDYARDFAKTSNAIKKSKEAAERTLTADEQAVIRLEDQIELTKELRDTQISALESLLTTEENIISVAQAIQEMAEAQVTYDEANALNDKLLEEYPELNRSILSVVDAVRAVEAAQGAYASAVTSAITAAAASAAASAAATASVSEMAIKEEKEITIVNSFKGGIFGKSGITLSNGQTFKTHKGFGDGKEIENATQMARDALIAQGITPAFASGGMHSGGLRMVGENGPELEVTGPSRIYSNTQTKSMLSETGDDRLRLEVSSLRVDMKALMMQISKNTGKSARQLDRWDQDGLPQERVV